MKTTKLYPYVLLVLVMVMLFSPANNNTALGREVAQPAFVPYRAGGDCYAAYYNGSTWQDENVSPWCNVGKGSPAPKPMLVEATEEVQAEPPTEVQPEVPTEPEPPVVIPPTPEPEKGKGCNKGGGNGPEGCDPGRNPHKGNDDENGPKEDKPKK